MTPKALYAAAFLAGVTLADAPGLVVLKAEPPKGRLSAGETVLVDDGTCPTGQIKQITGGNNVSMQSGVAMPGTRRVVACVARPR